MADKNEEVLNAVENAATNFTKADEKLADKDFQNTQALSDQERLELRRQNAQNWADTYNNIVKEQEATKYIDDGYLKNLPKSIVRMYKNGDFGDLSTKEGKKNARNTMGLAIVQTLANTLGNIGNSVAAVGGVNPGFQAQETVADTINKTNLQQGLENKWNKQKQSTANAIKLADQYGVKAEEALANVTALTSNARMESQFNRMNEQGKAYAIKVQQLVGEELGEMSNPEVLQFLQGASAMGMDPKQAAVIVAARYAPSVVGAVAEKAGIKLPDGTSAEDFEGVFAGVKDAVTGATEKPKAPKENTIETAAGSVSVPKSATKESFKEINRNATELNNMYLRGEITEEQWRKDYQALYDEQQSHDIASSVGKYYGYDNIKDPDKMFAENQKTMKMWTDLKDKLDASHKAYLDAIEARNKLEKGSKAYKKASDELEKKKTQYEKDEKAYKKLEEKYLKKQEKELK